MLRSVLSFALVTLALVGACAPEAKEVAATQLIVRVSAEPAVLSSLATLRLRTASLQDNAWSLRSERIYDKSKLNWPVDLVLALNDEAEAGHTFEIVLDAIDASGQVVVQSRSLTSFVLRRAQLLTVLLARCGDQPFGQLCATAECLGSDCQSCVAGTCVSTPFVPGQDLPPFTVETVGDAGEAVLDAGSDASPTSDAGQLSDATPASEAGNPATLDASDPVGKPDASASEDAGPNPSMDSSVTNDGSTDTGTPLDSTTGGCEASGTCGVADAGDASCTPGTPGCPPAGGCGSKPACGPNQACVSVQGTMQCQCRANAACPSGAANYCSGTNQYSCVADADGCLAPGPTSTCSVTNECKEPICTSGSGCGSRNRAGGTRCSTGVCDGSGTCVACLLDGDCRSGLVCDPRNKMCVVPECGDGLVTKPGEPCDPAASGTANDTWHCSPTCKTRTAYIICTSTGNECAATYSCQATAQGKSLCLPESGLGFSGTGHPNVVCPTLANYTQMLWSNAYCVISCNVAQDCPSHLRRCEDSPFAGAGPFEANKYCVPP